MQLVYGLLDEMEKEAPLCGTLTRLMLEDAVGPDDGSAWCMMRAGQTIVERLPPLCNYNFL